MRDPEEPANTSPTIDEAIKTTEQYFEELRESNSKIRTWGSDWKDIAESLRDENKKLDEQNDKLKSQIDELEDDIKTLREAIKELEDKEYS